MKNIIFVGSHLGYPMEKTPLGGGAMVGLQLVRHWPRADIGLTVLGSGPVPPCSGVEYVTAEPASSGPRGLVEFSELEYARFCRRFEAATTDWILSRGPRFSSKSTCVIVNDISEGPNLEALARRGYPIVSLWHVDVVDYFNKLYFRNLVRPERLTRLYDRLSLRRLSPDVLRLVFDKQSETVRRSRRMILPSRAMADTIARCYGGDCAQRMKVVPWGMWKEDFCEAEVEAGVEKYKAHFQIGKETAAIMTLSRISPEKGLHLLLRALRLLESRSPRFRRDICLFLCGEPAFMRGAAYWRRIQREAGRLKRTRIFFPGYLNPAEKQIFFRLSKVFVSPSIHESYGLNIVEAMRAGVPVLASDHYGVLDLDLERFGAVARYESLAEAPKALAEGLRRLLDAPNLSELGRRAREKALAMPFSAAAQKVLLTALEALE